MSRSINLKFIIYLLNIVIYYFLLFIKLVGGHLDQWLMIIINNLKGQIELRCLDGTSDLSILVWIQH